MSENTVDDDSDPAYWLADAIVKERALNRLMAARRADDVKFAKTAHRWACALWVAVPLLILWLLWDYRHDWRTIVVYFLIYGMAGAGYEFENDHGKRRRLITAEENARLSEDEQRVIASLKADIPKVIAASSPESVAHLRAIAADPKVDLTSGFASKEAKARSDAIIAARARQAASGGRGGPS